MDETFRQSILITYWSRLTAERDAGRERSLHAHVTSFDDPEARRVVLEEARPPQPGDRRLGPWRLLDRLGRGGGGDVWLAFAESTASFVALKTPSGSVDVAECREVYAREHRVAASLDHAALRRVFEPIECDGTPALVMEYVDGRTLRDVIAEHASGPVALDGLEEGGDRILALLAFFETCCHAVDVAHAAGVVHGDLKPANVLVTPDGRPVILDFGASVPADDAGSLDRGTLPYMAPERLDASAGPVDHRVDVYGLAATLFEALTLRRPHSGPHRESLAHAIATERPAYASDVAAHVPRTLAALLDRALAPHPRDRTPGCGALAAALRRERARILRRPLLRRARAAAALVVAVAAVVFLARGWPAGEGADGPPGVPVDVDALIDEGFLALDDLEPDRAMALFSRVLEAEPSSDVAVAGLSWAHFHRGDGAAAAAAVIDHERRFGRSKGLEILRILAERGEQGVGGDPSADPVDAWRDIDFSDDPVALFIMARDLLVRRGRTDRESARRAVKLFDRAILLSRAHRMTLYRGRAVAAGLAGDVEDAETAALAIRRRWPGSCVAWYYSGLALEIVDPARAERAYRRAVEIDDGYARGHLGLGWLLVRDGRADEGERHLRRAVAADPGLATAWVRLGYVLYGTRRTDEAYDCVSAAIELGHDGPETRFNYGANLVWAGCGDEGVALAERLLAARPGAPWLVTNLGACLVLTHRYHEAIERVMPVAESGEPDAIYALGLALEETGRLEEAAQRYRAALGALGAAVPAPGASVAARVDAVRPRPRYPEFAAAAVAEQLAWCEARIRRFEELARGARPADVSEAIAARLIGVTPESAGGRLACVRRLLAAPGALPAADHLVACIELALPRVRGDEELAGLVQTWMELALDRLEDEHGAGLPGCERHGRLAGRRHAPAFTRVLNGPAGPLRDACAEFWAEVDEILDRSRP